MRLGPQGPGKPTDRTLKDFPVATFSSRAGQCHGGPGRSYAFERVRQAGPLVVSGSELAEAAREDESIDERESGQQQGPGPERRGESEEEPLRAVELPASVRGFQRFLQRRLVERVAHLELEPATHD